MSGLREPVYGEQEGAACNGHFSSACYHPLFVFNQFGDCEGANLRPGNVHSAHDWREVLEPIMARYERAGVRRYFRKDWSLRSVQVKLIKIGGRLVRHARRLVFQLAEVAVP